MFKFLEHMAVESAIFTMYCTKMHRTLFGIGVKQHVPSNKATDNTNSFDETASSSTDNFGINSSHINGTLSVKLSAKLLVVPTGVVKASMLKHKPKLLCTSWSSK